jgi:predicted nucleic acid-binding protein
MIVVADTSPLNYLLQINCESALPALYKRIIVPSAVLAELSHPDTPTVVSRWLLHLPEWIDIRQTASQPDPSLALLDPGEREAIQLAQEHHAALLLIDERRGRLEAHRRGLATTGTLGVLLAAHQRGLLNAEIMYEQLLTTTNFRSTPELESRFLQRVRALRNRPL